MNKHFLLLLLLFVVPIMLSGQTSEQLLKKCKEPENVVFQKDYRIELPKLPRGYPEVLRTKVPYYLSKNTTYNFTLCSAEQSVGKLIMKIVDPKGMTQATSYTQSGQVIPTFNFECKSSGQYQLQFDFKDFQSGLGIAKVFMVKNVK